MEDNKVKQTDFGLIGFRATYTADNTNMYIAPSIKKETNLKPISASVWLLVVITNTVGRL